MDGFEFQDVPTYVDG